MRTISNSTTFRKNVVSKLLQLLKDENSAANLEKGIFNYSLKKAEERDVIKKWDNKYFVEIYLNQLRSIHYNLRESNNIDKIQEKKICRKTIYP